MSGEPIFTVADLVGAFAFGVGFAMVCDHWGRARDERERDKALGNPNHHRPPRSVVVHTPTGTAVIRRQDEEEQQ